MLQSMVLFPERNFSEYSGCENSIILKVAYFWGTPEKAEPRFSPKYCTSISYQKNIEKPYRLLWGFSRKHPARLF
ncbi:MAG: hypothetical protein D6714_12230, partial [Bacteroidetes bacterium]